MLYGSETWAERKEDVYRLRCTEMRIARWKCGATLNDRPDGIRITNEELRSRMGLEYISDVLKRGRLRWFGHAERMQEDNKVK